MTSVFTDNTYKENRFLTKTDAEFKASIISNVSYVVNLCMPKGDSFFGSTSIEFELKELPTRAIDFNFHG